MAEVLLSKVVSRALPRPNWAPKAVRTPLGTPLEAIWKHLWMIFDQIWTQFLTKISIKGMYVPIYRPYFVLPAPLTSFRPKHFFSEVFWNLFVPLSLCLTLTLCLSVSRGRRNGVSLLDPAAPRGTWRWCCLWVDKMRNEKWEDEKWDEKWGDEAWGRRQKA